MSETSRTEAAAELRGILPVVPPTLPLLAHRRRLAALADAMTSDGPPSRASAAGDLQAVANALDGRAPEASRH